MQLVGKEMGGEVLPGRPSAHHMKRKVVTARDRQTDIKTDKQTLINGGTLNKIHTHNLLVDPFTSATHIYHNIKSCCAEHVPEVFLGKNYPAIT